MSAPERISYLARRHPAFVGHAEWLPRWRAHWALAAAQPESSTVRRYLQCEVLFDLSPRPHDAVASAEYFSPEDRVRNRGAAGYHAIMREDELLVFDRAIAECSFIGTHHVLAGAGRGPYKAIRFVRRADGVPAEGFPAAWEGWASWLADGTEGGLLGYAQDRALPAPGPGGWGLAVDGSEEFWFGDAASAIRFLTGRELARRTARAPFTVVDAVVTDEVALKDAGVRGR